MLAVTLAAGAGRVSAQEAAAAPGPAAASASVDPHPSDWRGGGLALPAELAPPAWQQPGAGSPTLGTADGVVPYLSGAAGAIAGMIVATWWVQRDCRESCDQERLLMLFLGGTIGAMLGWLVGGGELPDDSPPDPRRWSL
jgi:hypothetical protein